MTQVPGFYDPKVPKYPEAVGLSASILGIILVLYPWFYDPTQLVGLSASILGIILVL